MNLKRASQLRRPRYGLPHVIDRRLGWRSRKTHMKLCTKLKKPNLTLIPTKSPLGLTQSSLTRKERQNISEMLTNLRSMQQTAQFELWTRMIDVHSLNLQQLKSVRTAIDDRIKLDIISNVPYEIAQYIMSFLKPKDLCHAAQTCRSWRIVAEDSRLWREFCEEEGVLDGYQTIDALFKQRISRSHSIQEKCAAKSISDLSGSQWKIVYLEHVRILRHWRTRKFDIKEPFIVTSPSPAVSPQPTNPRHDPSRAQTKIEPLFEQWGGQPDLESKPPRHMMQLRCHEDSVITCLQFNPKTKIIVSGSDDQTLKVWSSDTGHCINILQGHKGGVWSSQLSPDDIVISGSTDRTVRVWNAHSGKLIHVLTGHSSTVRCLALDGDLVVSGSRDQTLRIWNIKEGSCVEVLAGHVAAVRCVEFKNGTVVSGAYDYTVRVWDATTGLLNHQFEDHHSRIYSLQFDGRTIASGSLDTTICVWNAKTGLLRHKLEGHKSLTSKMQLKGDILVSANADSYAKIWDLKTGRCIHTLGGENKHTGAITSVYFNSEHVVTSSDDGSVKLWDTNTGNFIRDLVVLPTASNGGVVWRIRASHTKLICAVGSRSSTEDTHLLVLDFS